MKTHLNNVTREEKYRLSVILIAFETQDKCIKTKKISIPNVFSTAHGCFIPYFIPLLLSLEPWIN